MAWGGDESASETAQDAHFQHPNVLFMASSGDNGYGTSYPAASPNVIAVGGTHLRIGSSGRTSETVWTESGSGCSTYEHKPLWQSDTGCSGRSVTDVAADADPASGLAVYSSRSDSGAGWLVVGGTSLAAPLVAAMTAIAGPTTQSTAMTKLYGAIHTSSLYDVRTGTNGSCGNYLCTAKSGYDGPSGAGAPVGLGAL
jgi:subtilase family serine protease